MRLVALALAALCFAPRLNVVAAQTPVEETTDERPSQHDALAWIKVENAAPDAKAAIATGDFRLFGIHGYSLTVPGTRDGAWAPNGCGVKGIDGTSDAISDMEAESRAVEYAKQYNAIVLRRTHCLSRPMSQLGMRWSSSIDEDQQNLSYGAPRTTYDVVFWYCERGKVNLNLLRPRATWRNSTISISSEGVKGAWAVKPKALDRRLHRADLIFVRASLNASEPLFDAFARSGALSLNGQPFNAGSGAERAAIGAFVAACRARR